MKKIFWLVLLLVMVLLPAAGCGTAATTESGAPVQSAAAESQAASGTVLDYEGFSVTAADGWEQMDIEGGVQFYKPSGEILQIQIGGYNMTEEDAMAQMEGLQSSYGGSDIEAVQLLGMDFIKMSYSASGVEQCIYAAISQGEQIKIQATGKSYEDNGDIRAMVDSIVLK
jgi:hypothetical protein